MDLIVILPLCGVLIAAALYAHICIPRFTAGRRKATAAHAILVVVGIAAGAVGALIYRAEPLLALLSMLIGFGMVHVPAAIILFLKQQRHSGKS
jgi:tellurite resistance protein TehA-like permease